MIYTKLINKYLLIILILTLAGGCTITHSPVAVRQMPLTGGQVSPHRVALVLDQELVDYKQDFHLVGGAEVYPIGSGLRDYARNVADKSFQQVEIVPSEEQARSLSSVDLILIPRMVKSDTSFGAGMYNITFVMEWMAKDRVSRNTVWLKTVVGNASEAMGSNFTGSKHRRKVIQKAFDDLSLKTYEAFQAAHELK